MITRKLHIKNTSFGFKYHKEKKNNQRLYTFHFCFEKSASTIGQYTIAKYITIAILSYTKRIKIMTHKQTQVKQHIA